MNRIKVLRQKRGWRQEDLARLLNSKQQTVGNYETEARNIDVETIHKLCDIFEVSADYLLCRSDVPTPEISDEDWALLEAYHAADAHIREIVSVSLKLGNEKKESPAAV